MRAARPARPGPCRAVPAGNRPDMIACNAVALGHASPSNVKAARGSAPAAHAGEHQCSPARKRKRRPHRGRCGSGLPRSHGHPSVMCSLPLAVPADDDHNVRLPEAAE